MISYPSFTDINSDQKSCRPSSFTLWETIQNRLEHKIKAEVKAKAESLLSSGAIDFDAYPDNIELADLLLTAALQDIVAKRLRIASNKTRKELKNLECF
jgi:hypothetical protein